MFTRYGRSGLVLFAIALYGGPFLAGLARHDWAVLPVFVALFLLQVAVARKPDLSTAAGWASLTIMAATQVALVTLAWGTGLLGAVLIGAVMLPVWAPIAISAVAAGFGAWAWRDAAEMDVMLDSAIEALERRAAPRPPGEMLDWPPPSPEVRAALDAMLDRLHAVDTLDAELVDPVVARLEADTGAEAFDAFYDLAGQHGDANEPVVDYALLRYVARPAVLSRLIDRGEAGLAPQLLLDAPDDGVRAEARVRIADLLDAGIANDQLPDSTRLELLARAFPGEGFERLAAHCRRA